MWLAIEHPGRVDRLAVCCSAPRFTPPGTWVERAGNVRAEGVAPLVEAALGRWFAPAFRRDHPDVVARYRAMLSGVDPEGYAACCDALATADVTGQLGQIRAPTLVLGGAYDPVVPPASAASTMTAIPGASLCVLAGAAHLANVEQPGAFNSVVLAHLAGRPEERGEAVRRAVLGADHVERAMSGASELTAPFQEMLNLWPWGGVWARPGLEVETRRLIAIAILVALGRHGELEMHVRQALRAGTSTTTLRELLLQTAVYAGVPAANSAFAIANRVWTEVSGSADARPGEAGPAGAALALQGLALQLLVLLDRDQCPDRVHAKDDLGVGNRELDATVALRPAVARPGVTVDGIPAVEVGNPRHVRGHVVVAVGVGAGHGRGQEAGVDGERARSRCGAGHAGVGRAAVNVRPVSPYAELLGDGLAHDQVVIRRAVGLAGGYRLCERLPHLGPDYAVICQAIVGLELHHRALQHDVVLALGPERGQ